MKVEAKDLVVGNEYWIENYDNFGVFLGVDDGGFYHFTHENLKNFDSSFKTYFGRITSSFVDVEDLLVLKTDNTKEGLLTRAQQQIKEAKKQIAEANELIEKANEMIKQNQCEESIFLDKETLYEFLTEESAIAIRGDGEFKDKSYYLSGFYDWEIKTDSQGFLCLIPTIKK